MNNEETIYLDGINPKEIGEKKDTPNSWKLVALGGVSGVLMGAGSLYAGQVVVKELESDNKEESSFNETTENGLKVADVDQGMSFGQAFAAARAEVGPGGVFHWHGGIYNTYTEAEWNAMTAEQKHDFAQQVKPEISANEVPTPTDANTHIIVEHHVYHHDINHSANDVQTVEDVQEVHQQANNADSDVHIVGYGEIRGHSAVALDMDSDGQADVAIIDVDDSGDVSNPDLVVDRDGNYATIGELVNSDPNMEAANETPDISEGPSVEADYPLYDI